MGLHSEEEEEKGDYNEVKDIFGIGASKISDKNSSKSDKFTLTGDTSTQKDGRESFKSLYHQVSVPKVQFADEDNDLSDSDDYGADPNPPTTSKSIHNGQRNISSTFSCSVLHPRRTRTLSDTSCSSSTHLGALSRASSSTSSSTSYSFTAPDGGWGWVIVAASFLINMIADGITFSFGVLFVELQNEFEGSKAMTAGVVSLFHSVPLLSGPIASTLTDQYGCRKVTVIGAILAALGFFFSFFCYRIELLYITFGLISGFGLSLCYVAAIVIVAYYFDQKRSFATGISVCGSGVGTFVFAPLTQFLIEFYGGWRGATMILAGVMLNMVLCGMLFWDLEWTKKTQKSGRACKRKASFSGSQFSNFSNTKESMPEIDELKTLLESGNITTLFSREELEDCPRLCLSLVNIPTYIATGEQLPEEVISALSKNKAVYDLILHNYPETLGSVNSSIQTSVNCSPNINKSTSDHAMLKEPFEIKLQRKVSSLFKKTPNQSILKKTPTSDDDNMIESSPMVEQTGPIALVNPEQPYAKHIDNNNARKTINLHKLRIRRQSLTYRGAMLSINRYKLKTSSCPDIYRNSISTLANEGLEGGRIYSCIGGLQKFFTNCCQINFFNLRFLLFCISNFILYGWYDVMYVYLVDYSELHLGHSSQLSTLLLSMIGIFNTIGEVIIGYLGDQSWMNLNILYAGCMLACGLSTAIIPFLKSYSYLTLMAAIYGFAISANYSLTSPILVNFVSLEQFSNAYGFLLLVQGLSNLIGPMIAGHLYDVTLEWFLTFGCAGVSIAVSGFLLLIMPCVQYCKSKGTQNQSHTSKECPAGTNFCDSQPTNIV